MRGSGPLGYGLYRPNVVIYRDPKPTVPGEPAKPKARAVEPVLPRRSVRELIEIEFDRELRVTDATAGTITRMTMREVIAEQLMRLFTAGKSGAADLMIKLNTRVAADSDEFKMLYIGIPWDFEMPPRCDMYGRPCQASDGETLGPSVTDS